jgi:hypothetical protein
MFALSNGDGTFRNVASGQSFLGFPYGDPQATAAITPIDSNGDGRAELLFLNSSNDGWYEVAQIYNGSLPDLVASVSDGLGATATVSYKPLTDITCYAKDAGSNGSSYPVVDLQLPLYVVCSVSSSNGIAGTLSSNYKYGGLKSDFTRGSLGFRWMEGSNVATGLTNRSEYRQDWPYVGLPSLVRKTQGSGAVLSETTNTHGCIDPATGGVCAVSVGNRYFPYIAQSVEAGNDLNEAPLPTVATSMQYDVYGNATSVMVSTGDGYTKTTSNVYMNDAGNWLLGRLKSSTVQSTVP